VSNTEIKPQLLGLNAVCARTDLSKSTLYRLIASGQLRAVKVGKALRITESELSRFIESLENESVTI
jgi:excisionase family DNA binding protein